MATQGEDSQLLGLGLQDLEKASYLEAHGIEFRRNRVFRMGLALVVPSLACAALYRLLLHPASARDIHSASLPTKLVSKWNNAAGLEMASALQRVANRPIQNWPLTPGPQMWKPSLSGYTSKPKVMWFGADNGLTTDATLALMGRHAAAGYGWQQGWHAPVPGALPSPAPAAMGQGDTFESQALTKARQYMESAGNHDTMLFVYRQVQVALGLFSKSRTAADNKANDHFWLRGGTGLDKCLAQQPWGSKDPFWDFSVPDAAQFFLDQVIGQLIADPSLKGGRTAVFFDEVDQGSCGYRYEEAECSGPPPNAAKLQAATNAMLVEMVKRLNAAGIIPILSLNNLFSAAYTNLHGFYGSCALPEDTLVQALKGLQWVRFYEVWPWTNWYYNQWQDSPELYAANIANAILEAEAGIPTILHSGWFQKGKGDYDINPGCPAPSRVIHRPGPLGGGEVEFFIAVYLIVQSSGTLLSFSSNWRSVDFCWRPEFDVEYGIPLEPPRRTGTFSWERNYSKARVSVDVSKQIPHKGFSCGQCGSVHLLAEPEETVMFKK